MSEINVSVELQLMERYRLTTEEVFVIELLFLGGSDENHKEYLQRYVNLAINRPSILDTLNSLQDKGVIKKSCKFPKRGEQLDPETIDFNENFLHNYRKFSGELGEELLEVYPQIGYINGKQFSLNNYAKKFNSFEDFAFAYGKAIGWNMSKHKHVIELVDWAKKNESNLLVVGIGDFVISRLWNNIEKQKSGDGIMYFDNTTDI